MELWCVTAFFDPANSEWRHKNYERFALQFLNAGVNLLTVELTLPCTKRRLAGIGKTVHLESTDVLWHKESMLNHGFSLLPNSCDVAMSMDCDLLFREENWASHILRLAEQFEIIQCFQVAHYSAQYPEEPAYSVPGFVYHRSLNMPPVIDPHWGVLRGAPGGAWAFRAPIFRNHPFYDRTVIGDADRVFAESINGTLRETPLLERFSTAQQKDILDWACKNNRKHTMGYLPIDVQHLWHGGLEERRYDHLFPILREHQFDPRQDIRREAGTYRWNSSKPQLHQAVEAFLTNTHQH